MPCLVSVWISTNEIGSCLNVEGDKAKTWINARILSN